ncbi:MAG: hypothetical protein H8E44_24140 [Planctomycetes bacterium]|nr:hypothetical protein [Planctomycetota bacterium]MBL7042442.1 hypothetical protein [Pirellulaceae bacterium]
MIRVHFRQWMTDTVLAAIIAGLLGVLPSTVWAFFSGARVEEALLVPGELFVGRNAWIGTKIFVTIVVHGGMSLFWAGVLCALLPRRRPVINALGAGFSIAVLDLLVIAQAFQAVHSVVLLHRALDSFWPWLADHLVFGAVVGAVVAFRRRRDAATEDLAPADQTPPDSQGEEVARFALPRPAVSLSFVISVVGFVITGAVQGGDAFLGVICGVFYPPLLFLFLLALVGMVLSIRQPSRIGWLFCAHACLLAYYITALDFAKDILRSISC